MSNAGPLTTTFTAPSSCATAAGLYQIWPASGASSYYYEQGPLLTRTDCYPSGYDASPSQYYSPALCPSGYTPACSSTAVVSATATETAYTCCPTAATYTCAGAADALTSSSLPYFGCTTAFDQALVLLSVTAISNGSTDLVQSTTEGAGQGLGANSIAVRFREGDFSTTSGATASLASTTEVLSLVASDTGTLELSAPTSTSSSDASASTTKEKHTGVSTTQAIGIGVGSAGFVLLAAGAAGLFLWIRRKKQRQRALVETPIPPPAPPPKDRRFRPPPPPPLNLDRSRSHSYSHNSSSTSTSSGIASVARSVNGKMIRGPFELGPHGKGKAGLFEMYGGYSSQSQLGSSLKSADPTRSNTVTPSFWSPPPSYGSQPAELESSSSPPPRNLESPQWSATSAASGHHRGRAELASP